MKAYGSGNSPKTPDEARDLEILLEAARRANWDALHGPPHLQSGRFNLAPARPVPTEVHPQGRLGRPQIHPLTRKPTRVSQPARGLSHPPRANPASQIMLGRGLCEDFALTSTCPDP